MLDAKQIVDHADRLRRRDTERDQRWADVRAIREGKLEQFAPDLISDDWPKPIVANFIDTTARDLAELIAPLPSMTCSSTSMSSDKAKRFADLRTKILQHYLAHSRLDRHMLESADHYSTYACAVFYLEPDFKEKLPRICVESPVGAHAEIDRWGRVTAYTKRYYCDAQHLAELYPEHAEQIAAVNNKQTPGMDHQVELVRYCSADQISLVLVGKTAHMLASGGNPLGRTPVVLVRRPWLEADTYKGQFDDVLWLQVARGVLGLLNLEAVQKSVQAPIAVDDSVQELPFGPDAVLRSKNPEKIRRVGMEIPNGAFGENGVLLQELRDGTRYPAARSGGVDASVITGKGVQALMGGFDSQVKAAQTAYRDALKDVAELCFAMDETYWPHRKKSIRGHAAGTPYNVTYTPSKDIDGDHTCDVSYGFAAGMDPNRAVVMLLQLRAEKVFSRDYFARQLPFDINISEELTKVDVEETREALKQGVYGYVQSIPAMAQSGMDPADAVLKVALILKGLQKGESIEDVVSAAFAPAPVPELESGGPGGGDAGGLDPAGASGGGLSPAGLMPGVAPGQAGMAPGGKPDLSVMLAGLTAGGKPSMSAQTVRRRAI